MAQESSSPALDRELEALKQESKTPELDKALADLNDNVNPIDKEIADAPIVESEMDDPVTKRDKLLTKKLDIFATGPASELAKIYRLKEYEESDKGVMPSIAKYIDQGMKKPILKPKAQPGSLEEAAEGLPVIEKPEVPKGPWMNKLKYLGVAENAIAYSIRKASGKSDKNFWDTTFTDVLGDAGFNTENTLVKGFGLGLSFATPVVPGVSVAQKGVKGLSGLGDIETFSKTFARKQIERSRNILANAGNIAKTEGRDVNEVIKEAQKLRVDAEDILKINTEVGLTKYGMEARNKELQLRIGKRVEEIGEHNITDDLMSNIVKQEEGKLGYELSELAKATNFKATSLTGESALLRKEIFASGGVKLLGKTVITGEEIGLAMYKSKIPQTFAAVSEAVPPIGRSLDFFKGAVETAKKAFVTEQRESKTLDRLTNLYYGAQANVDKLADDSAKYASEFFDGFSKKELRLFNDTMKRGDRMEADLMEAALREGREVSAEELKPIFDMYESELKQSPKVYQKIRQWIFKDAEQMAKDAGVPKEKILVNYWTFLYQKRVSGDRFSTKFSLADSLVPSKKEWLLKQTTDGFNPPPGYVAIHDPMKTLAIQKTRIAMANEKDKLFKSISDEFGIVVKPGDEVPQGYTKLVPYMDNIERELMGNLDIKKFDHVYIPDSVKGDIEFLALKEKSVYIPLISDFTNMWKAGVTVLFPANQFKNMVGNILNNVRTMGLHGANPKHYKVAEDLIYYMDKPAIFKSGAIPDKYTKTDIGELVSIKSFAKEIEEIGLVRGNHIVDFESKLTSGSKGKQLLWNTLVKSTDPTSVFGNVYEFARQFAEHNDNLARFAGYTFWRMKGLNPKMAAAAASEAVFDYRSLTQTEKWIKEIVPFYSFNALNIKALVKTSLNNPDKLKNYHALLREVIAPPDKVPAYLKNKLAFQFGNQIVYGFSHPLIDATEAMSGLFSPQEAIKLVHPLIRLFAEKAAGRDFNYDKDIRQINKANEFKTIYDVATKGIPGAPDWINSMAKSMAQPIVDWMKLQPDPRNRANLIADPNLLHVLRAMPTARAQSTWGMLNREDVDMGKKTLRGLFGITPISVSKEAINHWTMEQYIERHINTRLLEKNLGYEFRRVGISKQGYGEDLAKDVSKEFSEFLKEQEENIENGGRPREKDFIDFGEYMTKQGGVKY